MDIKLLQAKLTPPTTQLKNVLITEAELTVYILRLDLTHPEISGNKWFKLKYNIEEALKLNHSTILTFGGSHSNHIAATAAAGKLFGLKTIGIIRGEEARTTKSKTLEKAEVDGMQLNFISREEYRKKNEHAFIDLLKAKFGEFYLIPEGGANRLGVKGCEEILDNVQIDFDYLCCSCGTGSTLAGIINSLKPHQLALGYSALKGGEFLEKEIKRLSGSTSNSFKIITDYHFGGYAKMTPELLEFMKKFEIQNNFHLDQVYTAKMVFGVYDMIEKGLFPKNKTLLVIHTGGLQGNSIK